MKYRLSVKIFRNVVLLEVARLTKRSRLGSTFLLGSSLEFVIAVLAGGGRIRMTRTGRLKLSHWLENVFALLIAVRDTHDCSGHLNREFFISTNVIA